MISRRQILTAASASLALTAFSITSNNFSFQRHFNLKVKPGEIYRVVFGNYYFDDLDPERFPDLEEHLIYCFGFELACYSEHLYYSFQKTLPPGEIRYFFHFLEDFQDEPVYFVDSNFKDLAKFELVS